jgi:hypothetical protein
MAAVAANELSTAVVEAQSVLTATAFGKDE